MPKYQFISVEFEVDFYEILPFQRSGQVVKKDLDGDPMQVIAELGLQGWSAIWINADWDVVTMQRIIPDEHPIHLVYAPYATPAGGYKGYWQNEAGKVYAWLADDGQTITYAIDLISDAKMPPME